MTARLFTFLKRTQLLAGRKDFAGREWEISSRTTDQRGAPAKIDKGELTISEPRRHRDKNSSLRSRVWSVGEARRRPLHPAPSNGTQGSDELTVPPCRRAGAEPLETGAFSESERHCVNPAAEEDAGLKASPNVVERYIYVVERYINGAEHQES
jgi:hypothetical protein